VGGRSSQHRALRFNRLVLGSPNHSTPFSNYKTNLLPCVSAQPSSMYYTAYRHANAMKSRHWRRSADTDAFSLRELPQSVCHQVTRSLALNGIKRAIFALVRVRRK
jgi:hypothetical protein